MNGNNGVISIPSINRTSLIKYFRPQTTNSRSLNHSHSGRKKTKVFILPLSGLIVGSSRLSGLRSFDQEISRARAQTTRVTRTLSNNESKDVSTTCIRMTGCRKLTCNRSSSLHVRKEFMDGWVDKVWWQTTTRVR